MTTQEVGVEVHGPGWWVLLDGEPEELFMPPHFKADDFFVVFGEFQEGLVNPNNGVKEDVFRAHYAFPRTRVESLRWWSAPKLPCHSRPPTEIEAITKRS